MTDKKQKVVDLARERRINATLDQLAERLRGDPGLAQRTFEHLETEESAMAKKRDCVPENAPAKQIMLTLDQVADFLQMSVRHVYRLRDEHGLPAFKVGGAWRVGETDLVNWLQERRTP